MEKTLFEQMGEPYTRVDDYYLPALALPAQKENKPIDFGDNVTNSILQKNKKTHYTILLISDELSDYFADIDEQTRNMFSWLVKEYANSQGVTEQLKTTKPVDRVQRINDIRSSVEEITNAEQTFK